MKATIILFIYFFLCGLYIKPLKLSVIKPAPVGAIPTSAKKLISTYPDLVSGYADNYLIFKDKSKMLWDDGIKNKPWESVLDNPDLKDMFLQKYTAGKLNELPVKDFEPGRIRNEAFFKKMYGQNEDAVRQNLIEITWCPKVVGQKIRVTKINGVNKRLSEMSAELDEHPELKQYLTDIGGSFLWRKIKGTNRQSMHSFGMTIDINTKYSDYWEWACKCTNETADVNYKNRIPQIIVDIFEKHGFIWGGKWYHYDTMHFEYRPELLK
jgi:hypothetical protein